MDSEDKVGRALGENASSVCCSPNAGTRRRCSPAGLVTRASRKLWRPIGRALLQTLADCDPRLLERTIDQTDPSHYADLCRGAREVAGRFTLAVHASRLETTFETILETMRRMPAAPARV